VQVEVADVLIQVDETRVKKSWVNKLEVVDMLKRAGRLPLPGLRTSSSSSSGSTRAS
jgi:hypothetical protein